MSEQWKQELTDAARECIRCEKICRANPISWSARGPDPRTEEGQKYLFESDAWQKAESKLWMLTDVEYDDKDALRAACWQWRYCKVMARKCCFIQLKFPKEGSRTAGDLMSNLHHAEATLMKLLGLENEYKSPCQYIEEQFPNLRKK